MIKRWYPTFNFRNPNNRNQGVRILGQDTIQEIFIDAFATVGIEVDEHTVRIDSRWGVTGVSIQEIEWGWGVGCRASVRAEDVEELELKSEKDGKMYECRIGTRLEPDFSWSSTTRDLTSALAAIELYEKVVKAVSIAVQCVNTQGYFGYIGDPIVQEDTTE